MKSPQPRILCVDDNEDMCAILSILLADAGYLVKTATSYSEGLALAQAEPFDLYVIDYNYADGGGLELCRHIHLIAPQRPIVFYSADVRESIRNQALNAGARAYLTKPDDADTLEETIASLL